MKRWFFLLVSVLVSGGIFYLALRGVDWAEIQNSLAHANYWLLLPATLVDLVALLTRAERWRLLLSGRLPLGRMFHATNIGYLLNSVLPMRLGELGRAFLVSRGRRSAPVFMGLSSILVERVLDLLVLMVLLGILLAALPVGGQVVSLAGFMMGAVGAAIFAALMVIARRPQWARGLLGWLLEWLPFLSRLGLERRLEHFLEGLEPLTGWRAMLSLVFWSIVTWLASLLTVWLTLLVFFPDGTFLESILLTCATSIGMALPPSVAGLGVYEGSVLAALLAIGRPYDLALACGIVMHGFSLVLFAALGAIGLTAEGLSLADVVAGTQSLSLEAASGGQEEL